MRYFQKWIKKREGFTLMEIVIGCLILGIIAALGVKGYGTVAEDSKKARVKSDLESIYSAGQMYYADMGSYPVGTVSTGTTEGTVCTTLKGTATSPSSGETKGPWLTKCPFSPYSGGSYTTSGATTSAFNVTHASTGQEFNKTFKDYK